VSIHQANYQNSQNYGVVNRGDKFTYRELVLGTEELDLDLVNTRSRSAVIKILSRRCSFLVAIEMGHLSYLIKEVPDEHWRLDLFGPHGLGNAQGGSDSEQR
jgi:hypothetical protein